MRVISIKRLREFWRRHADAEEPLRNWYKTVSGAEWKSLQDARATYPYADGVQTADGQTLTVFNISGNRYGCNSHISLVWLSDLRVIRVHASGAIT